MSPQVNVLLYWLPRVIEILVILFLGIFAIDVFAPGRPVLVMVGLFFLHLAPNYLLILILFIAWKKELIGGILFILVGALFTYFYSTYLYLWNFMFVSFPVFLVGFLFLVHYTFRRADETQHSV